MANAASPLAERIVACRRCPRLIAHCREVAREKRRAYREETYWGKPIPPFGVKDPRLLVVGLAPGAHGANRTGRIFTGDSSGDWLYQALFDSGFANQPESVRADDGLRLRETVVSCAVRCAPPQNRPSAAEAAACRPYLEEELAQYRRVRVIVALGRFAFDAVVRSFSALGKSAWSEVPVFHHGTETRLGDAKIALIASYHPSRQNTQTGRLTRPMFARPFARAKELLEECR
jgi:uracil-DNA glycosylase family 4